MPRVDLVLADELLLRVRNVPLVSPTDIANGAKFLIIAISCSFSYFSVSNELNRYHWYRGMVSYMCERHAQPSIEDVPLSTPFMFRVRFRCMTNIEDGGTCTVLSSRHRRARISYTLRR